MPLEPSVCPAALTISDGAALASLYRAVRQATERLCDPLVTEDYVIQSMPEASPVKWHLAHTTWFFETFLLVPHLPRYRPFRPEFGFLFNSYYEAVGPRWPRPRRGLLSRPTVAEVEQYRAYVDVAMAGFFEAADDAVPEITALAMLGIQHEQQHQELIITDLKHAWAANPLRPVYRAALPAQGDPPPRKWIAFREGLAWIGHSENGFCFDNETPRHRVFLHDFQMANRPATCAEYAAFIADGGYDRPELWLSDGWAARQAAGWMAPLYWEEVDGAWCVGTLSGLSPLHAEEPVCHVSYYEADAFARWAGARLPTEAEWETAASGMPVGHFQEGGRFQPAAVPAADERGPVYQLYGDVWQWTASPYTAYPGYQPLPGILGQYDGKLVESGSIDRQLDVGKALSEYNAKFMINQMVLRGASCATPRSHARRTYRNFFPPDARWQFSGIRLARD